MTLFEYAVQLNEDSIDDICAFAEHWGWDLRMELKSVLWDNLGNHTYPYIDMLWDYSKHKPVSFNYIHGNTFEATWHFGEGTRGPFQRIWRN
jgi:hypothetical protein